MAGYVEDRERNGLGCFLASLWLIVAFPLFVILLLGGGGCEGAPQPCTPNRWPEFAFIAMFVALGVGTAWTTKTLRSGKRNASWWVALALAVLLLAAWMFLVWGLATF